MHSSKSGADIQARSSKPSIDLAKLVEFITQAIPTSNNNGKPDAPDPSIRQAFLFEPQKNRLRVCTSGVLIRLFKQQDFQKIFNSTQGDGFIQNLQMPGFGIRSLIGSHLTPGNAEKLPIAVDRLVSQIDRAIDAALPEGTALSSLLLDNPEQQLKQLAKEARTTFKQQANTANLIPLTFKPQASTTEQRAVAKVISAVELIEASDYFESMCSAVSEYLQHQLDCDEDEVEVAVDSLAAEHERVDSQIARFLNFLNDEALARVRLNVAFRIATAIADNARKVNQLGHQLLAEYVSRVTILFETSGSGDYVVDLAAHYGIAAEFDLYEQMSKATFYSCLPVWPEWKTQIFEERVSDWAGTGYAVAREVSYRFRVNGENPELHKPAFEARLDKLEEELLREETARTQPGRLCRRLAELVFLAIVVPEQGEESLSRSAIIDKVQMLLASLRTSGKVAVNQVIQNLRQRAASMQLIATALISTLRAKGQKVIAQVQQNSCQHFICVKRGIVEWTRLKGAEPGVRDLLVGPQQSAREQIEWFKHIEICDRPDTPNLLFSVQVTTEIIEHDLMTNGEPQQIKAQRLLPQQLLQICWVPYCAQKQNDGWSYKVTPNTVEAKGWVLPASIHIEYESRILTRRQNKKQAEESKQYHAAVVCAFAVLVYCSLWCTIRRLKQFEDRDTEFTALMLRLQETSRPNDENSGDSYVYAAAQTIEAMLAQDVRIRMQGLALENLTKQNNSYVKLGVFDALSSAFPIAIDTPTPPVVAKIGLISYATRPCDESPYISSDEKGHLFLTQSYVATACQQPFIGYQLKAERMQSDVVDSPEQLKKQRLVQEEIGHLKAQGCQHVILLSHSYGSRHLNRTADRHSPLTPKEFLEEVSQTFPDLTIYTMLRDVFPATRLRNRTSGEEAAFEILQAEDHTSFFDSVKTKMPVRDLIPIYTFATLHAIEAQQRPQSGFCVYFLVSDRRVSNWTERPRQHLIDADPEQRSAVRPCLIAVLRGLHFIEAERGAKRGQLIPVLDPFSWISPTTKEAAGEVQVMQSRRSKGQVLLSYPAMLSRIAPILHRRRK